MTDRATLRDHAPDTRAGLPPDLQDLLLRYPREIWPGHANLGAMAQFWLKRHEMFRDLGAALGDALTRFRAGGVQADAFAGFFAPRLQFMLRELQTHHQVEDYHYFPLFRAAEARLARGFDLLDADHHVIHDAIGESAQAANAFLRALFPDGPSGAARALSGDSALLRASDAYADVNARLIRVLTRHLADEEDLIVPLILDRGEEALGVGE